MATSEQIKSLIRAHMQDKGERFLTTALQLAAYEARQGHTAFASEIRDIVDREKVSSLKVIPLRKDFVHFVLLSSPEARLADIILKKDVEKRIKRVLREYYQKHKLLKHGLENRRKILLVGPPGTGKTMTASVIAGELHLPLYAIQADKIVTKFMGETSAKLRQLFDAIKESKGVFLFDEFDAIGSERGREDDVGEMRRVLNSFLQFIETDTSESIIIAATNNMKLLDQALFRRFDDILYYDFPNKEEAVKLIKNRLGTFLGKLKVSEFVQETQSLSHSEITQACYDAIKDAILEDKKIISKSLMKQMLLDRKSAYKKKNSSGKRK